MFVVVKILNWGIAVLYATVSASFIIEQLGLPTLALGEDGTECWNGDSPQRRLEMLIDTI